MRPVGEPPFDRRAEDAGNIIGLDHINLAVPDQRMAGLFYVDGLGCARDSGRDFGTRNLWLNAGGQQFHLPTGAAQRFCGCIEVVVPDIESLKRRLDGIDRDLRGTDYARDEQPDCIRLRCPWGNAIRVCGPQGGMRFGIAGARVDVRRGAAAGIARFYAEVLRARVEQVESGEGGDGGDGGERGCAVVRVGGAQRLAFRECAAPPDYDGHHIAIYVTNFSAPYFSLLEGAAITEESSRYQYRFRSIVDPRTGAALATLEHEVRSLSHPLHPLTG